MLEIRKTAVSFDEREMMDLERIITDADEERDISISQEVHLRSYFTLSVGETQILSSFH